MPTSNFTLSLCPLFDTEQVGWKGYDFVTNDGTRYSGGNCPVGVAVTPATQISWTSSSYGVSVHGSGWQICGPPLQSRYDLALAAGVDPGADPVCFTDYLIVQDDRRLTVASTQGSHPEMQSYDATMPPTDRCDDDGTYGGHGPFGLGQTGTTWYRLPFGRSLATRAPGYKRCGTGSTGWLSGWPSKADSKLDRLDCHYVSATTGWVGRACNHCT